MSTIEKTTKKGRAVKGENITPAATGKIDLHLQSPEKVEETIKKEVAKLNEGFEVAILDRSDNKKTPREKIAILKKMIVGENEETGITINGIEDEEGYKKADRIRLMLVKLRTGVAAKHKSLKENYLKVSKALDAEKNDLSGMLEEIEKVVCSRLKVIDDIRTEKEEAGKRAKQEKIDSRVAEIKANGMEFIGGFYTIGQTISLDIVTLENLDEDQYKKFIYRVKLENDQKLFIAKKADQRKRVDNYLFTRAQRKQELERQRLATEAENQKRERTQNRLDALEMIGFTHPNAGMYYQYKNDAGNVTVTLLEVETMEGAEWRQRVFELNGQINELLEKDRQKKEQDKKDRRDFERHKKLTSLGFVSSHTDKEYFLLTELGKTNIIKQADLFNDNIDFEKWFIEELRPGYDLTMAESQRLREAKQKKTDRAQQRVAELINGFGFVYGVGEYYVKSRFEMEPELTGAGLYIEEKDVIEMDEEQWTKKINSFTILFSALKEAEQTVEERKKREEKERRQSLLSEFDRLKEYIETVKQIKLPVITEASLTRLLDYFQSSIVTVEQRLQDTIK